MPITTTSVQGATDLRMGVVVEAVLARVPQDWTNAYAGRIPHRIGASLRNNELAKLRARVTCGLGFG